MADLPVMPFAVAADWEQWLETHHLTAPGLWVKMAKKETGILSITYDEALKVALCFGWIDGQKNKFDDQYWLQKFTPRRRGSKWSQRNQELVAALIDQGKMRAAGQREIDAAKADGRWDAAYASPSKMTVPEDFQAALDLHPAAAAFFAGLNSVNRYAILYRIQDTRKPETRRKRIDQFIEMLLEGKMIYGSDQS